MNDKPQLIIRIGSHAEKDYILKLQAKFDGIIKWIDSSRLKIERIDGVNISEIGLD